MNLALQANQANTFDAVSYKKESLKCLKFLKTQCLTSDQLDITPPTFGRDGMISTLDKVLRDLYLCHNYTGVMNKTFKQLILEQYGNIYIIPRIIIVCVD